MHHKIWVFDLNICLHFTTLLKEFCHRPSGKKENKTKKEIDKLANKAISPCLQYPKDH